ncbi:MAG: acyl-CoA dehydrogenase [Betaproteobacteria bacterium]|nr:acyl-CoA dehydrogenase [Betaproteobacteria bacterium]
MNQLSAATTNAPDRKRMAAEVTMKASARNLKPLIDRLGPANESDGELSPEVVDALHQAGLFGMWAPREVGGAEMHPIDSLEALEDISYAHGSTGWVLMAAALCTGTAACFLGSDSVKRIFSLKRFPVIAGQGGSGGKAVATRGGYTVSGNWNYGSGIKHADYLHCGVAVFDAEDKPRMDKDGLQEQRIAVLSPDQCEYGANWDVLGLRATGSIDYTASGAFVPEDATHLKSTIEPILGGNLYRLGLRGLSTIGHTGFTLGIGRRILDEIAAIARTKQGRLGNLADNTSFQEDYGTAEAKFRSARAFIFDTWHEVEATLAKGETLSVRQWTLVRLALNHITWTTADICSFAYFAGGGTSLREGALQRCFRDMHAATQHLTSSPRIRADCGRELAGLAPGETWAHLGLAPPA